MAGVSEELARLAQLRDQGVLTDEEFADQKARLLAGETAAATDPPVPPKSMSALGKGCLIIVGIFVGLLILGSIVGGGGTAPTTSTAPTAPTPSADANSTDVATPAREPAAVAQEAAEPPGLVGPQANAARSARQYLEMTGFSRQGLIDQLSSDAGSGYEVADATAAVDSLDADWNEQAARSAKQYLEMTGFSCSGLIDQLSSDAGSQ